MGTSTSSSGGKAGSPFDPEWLSPPQTGGGDTEGAGEATSADDNDGVEGSDDNASEHDGSAAQGAEEPGFAPNRRYAEARTKMSGFLGGGDREALRGAIRGMVTKGMGGSRRAASTMRGSAQGAAALGQFLSSARDQTDPRVQDWVERVKRQNLSADDLILELVKEVMPDTGSVDEESLRNSAVDALGQLYEQNPDLDLFALTDSQIRGVMAITIANEVCSRVDLQLGQTYEKLKYGAAQIQLYRNDVREYVRSEVQVVMDGCTGKGLDPQRLAHEVLQSALEVFAS
jgi:hypothetical protein